MFSIIIPTYNRPDALERTVSSILDLNISSEYEIIIVNDHPEIPIKKIENHCVSVIENEQNLGRSKSRNKGAQFAKYQILFFIDDDIEVKENLFDKYISLYKSDYDAIFSNVKNVRTDGNYSLLNDYLNTRGANKKNFQIDLKSNYFTSAFCSIKKSFFDKIGRFDENFIGYGWENPELGLRISSNSGKIGFVRSENLFHYHDKGIGEWIAQIENSGRNLRYLIEKHPGFKKNIRYNILTSVLGMIAFNPFFRAVEKHKAKRLRGIYGYLSLNYLFYSSIYKSLTK